MHRISAKKAKRKYIRTESVEIDNNIKELLIKGAKKAGNKRKLAEIMGYSVPSNMISQLLSAPKYNTKRIPIARLKRLETFLE